MRLLNFVVFFVVSRIIIFGQIGCGCLPRWRFAFFRCEGDSCIDDLAHQLGVLFLKLLYQMSLGTIGSFLPSLEVILDGRHEGGDQGLEELGGVVVLAGDAGLRMIDFPKLLCGGVDVDLLVPEGLAELAEANCFCNAASEEEAGESAMA